MNISTPPSLRSPVKARSDSSHLCPRSTSKLLHIILSIGAVGLLLVNQNYRVVYDDLENTSTLDGSAAMKSPTDSDDTNDRQLRKPTQAVVEAPQLDFAVVGFEKTGTTFLLEVFGNHPEITMPVKHSPDADKICVRKEEGKETLKRWIQTQQQEQQSNTMKYGVKCSEMIRKPLGIENWADVSSANLIVGVRHPVEWFQSNYNYRVMLHHKDDKSNDKIPSAHKLTDLHNTWHGVSTIGAQFDKYLMQLGKTSLDRDELSNMLDTLSTPDVRVNHNPLKVFLYTIEQLEDSNTTRRSHFETDLQQFLGLERPFDDFSSQAKSNVNKVTYPEYIDICQSDFDSLRKSLVKEGKKSSEWIVNRFLMAEDVVVSDVEYFSEKVRAWGEDPCSVAREKL